LFFDAEVLLAERGGHAGNYSAKRYSINSFVAF
jgi:hypothetical protein